MSLKSQHKHKRHKERIADHMAFVEEVRPEGVIPREDDIQWYLPLLR